MYNTKVLERHIADAESAVQTLCKLKRYSIEEIERDRELLWAIERGLHPGDGRISEHSGSRIPEGRSGGSLSHA